MRTKKTVILLLLPRNLKAGTVKNAPGMCQKREPVSYTHLDVYKRQVLQNVADDEDEVELALQLEKEKKVKGIIFLGGMYNYDESRLRMLRVPYVISGSGKTVPEDTGTYPKSALVTTDTEIESQSMVDYLCSCGHKRIAFITCLLYTSY